MNRQEIQNRLREIVEAEFNIRPVPPGPTELQCYEMAFNFAYPHYEDDDRELPAIVWDDVFNIII